MKFFVLVVVPIIEIVAAAVVAHFIGWPNAIVALLVLSFIGAWQVKVQGLAAWRTARVELAQGASPAPAVLDGALRLVGAVLVAAPGFVTALVGGLLLIGPARRFTSRNAGQRIVSRFGIPLVVVTDDGATGWRFYSTSDPEVVDVEGWEDGTPKDAAPTDPPVLTPGSSRY